MRRCLFSATRTGPSIVCMQTARASLCPRGALKTLLPLGGSTPSPPVTAQVCGTAQTGPSLGRVACSLGTLPHQAVGTRQTLGPAAL